MNSQTAITLLKNLEQSLDDYCELNDEGKTAFSMAITALELFGISEQLPSVQPRKGKWIYGEESKIIGNPYGHYRCDQCNEIVGFETNFCPNCGADMREGDAE